MPGQNVPPAQNADAENLKRRVGAAMTELSDYVLASQGRDGGWGRYPGVDAKSELESSCLALIWLIRRSEQRYALAIRRGVEFLCDRRKDEWGAIPEQTDVNERINIQRLTGLATFTVIQYIAAYSGSKNALAGGAQAREELAHERLKLAARYFQEWAGGHDEALTASAVYWVGSAILAGITKWTVMDPTSRRSAFQSLSETAAWPEANQFGWRQLLTDRRQGPELGPTNFITYLLLQNSVTRQAHGTRGCVRWIDERLQGFNFSKDEPDIYPDVVGRAVSTLLLDNPTDTELDKFIEYLVDSRKDHTGWVGDDSANGVDLIVSFGAARGLWEWKENALPKREGDGQGPIPLP